MTQQVPNFVTTTLRAPVAPGDTQLQLAAGGGALFSAISTGNWCYVTVNDSVSVEVMTYTSAGTVINDTISVTRAQDGTTAKAFPVGSCVAVGWNTGQVVSLINQTALALLNTTAAPNTILVSGTPVGAPAANILYAVDPNTGQIWFWNGGLGAWVYLNSNSVQLSTTAPTSAPPGNIVWDIDTTTFTLYYWTGLAWISVGGSGGSTSFLQINTRRYLNIAGSTPIAKPTDTPFSDLVTGGLSAPPQCLYKSNTSIPDVVTVNGDNEIVFTANCVVQLTGSVFGEKALTTDDFHGALTIFHSGDQYEWQQEFLCPANSGTVSVSAAVMTDPFQVVAGDRWDMNLTVYDGGGTYAGFNMFQLSFGASVIALI